MAETALVTGGAGFLGEHLVRRLLTDGWDVHVTSRSQHESRSSRLTFHRAELTDFDVAKRILEAVEPQVVFHLAGSVGAAPDKALVLDTYHSHVTSALNLLTLADDFRVRKVLLTGSLLEPVGDVRQATPSSPYAAAKLTMTLYARMFHYLYDSPVVVARPFMTYGPGQHQDKVLPYVIRNLLDGFSPKLASGVWRTDWIYISDVVEGLLRATQAPGTDGAVVDLGCGELKSVREVVTAVHALMDTDLPLRFGDVADRPSAPEVVADVSTAWELLHWKPRVGIDEGLALTIEWYRAVKFGEIEPGL